MSMLSYVAPPKYVVETVKNRLNAMIIVGSMGSGKTTWTLNKIGQAQRRLLELGVDDDLIVTVHAQGTKISKIVKTAAKEIDLKKVKYIYLFNDDALAGEGQFGRTFFSIENISESQFYTMLRHELNKLGFNGFIFAVHATQVYYLLDKTFRTTAKIHAFKDMPMDPKDRREIGLMLGKAYYRALKEISRKIWSPKSREELIEGLSSCVVNYLGSRKIVKAKHYKVLNYVQIREEGKEKEEISEEVKKSIYYFSRKLNKLREKGVLVFQSRSAYIKHNGVKVNIGSAKHIRRIMELS